MQRIFWIDNLKAFAIFSVVAGHLMTCDAFQSEIGKAVSDKFIMSFHMPLFAVLSGWFLKYKLDVDFGSQLLKKVYSILFPYFIWCFLWFFIRPIVETLFGGNLFNLSSLIWHFKFFLYDGLCHYGWWFLRALFFCFLFAYASILICNGRMLYAGIGSCLLLYLLSLTGILPNMPEKDCLLKGFVFLYPFFWTGYAFHYCEKFIDGKKSWLLPGTAILFIIFLFFWQGADTFYDMNTSAIGTTNEVSGGFLVWKTCWRYGVGVTGSLFFILLFKRYCNRYIDFITPIGSVTLGIYILQSIVYWSLPSYNLLSDFGNLSIFGTSLILSTLIVFVSQWVVDYSSKSHYLASCLWGNFKR